MKLKQFNLKEFLKNPKQNVFVITESKSVYPVYDLTYFDKCLNSDGYECCLCGVVSDVDTWGEPKQSLALWNKSGDPEFYPNYELTLMLEDEL